MHSPLSAFPYKTSIKNVHSVTATSSNISPKQEVHGPELPYSYRDSVSIFKPLLWTPSNFRIWKNGIYTTWRHFHIFNRLTASFVVLERKIFLKNFPKYSFVKHCEPAQGLKDMWLEHTDYIKSLEYQIKKLHPCSWKK